jgi:hypothetical protein
VYSGNGIRSSFLRIATRNWQEIIKYVDFVELAIRNPNVFGNISLEIEQSMQFHGGFGMPKLCPGKKRKA